MLNIEEKDIKKVLFRLIGITTIIKMFIAATLELSVDEVYYWTYALYPDWSHFDHPPMVGWIIQLFSFNLLFDNELALRFGAIVISAINTYVIYSIGKSFPTNNNGTDNALTGLYAAMLFNASIYASVLAGNFIIPDTPQLLFWLLSLKFLLKSLPKTEIGIVAVRYFLLACLFAGMSIISKYHGVFIWVGIGLYVLLYNRNWLKSPYFYLGALISALFVLPIIIWNIQNDWISFNFHSDRVANELIIRMDYLLTELLGQIAYNNPINYMLIVIALIATYKGHLSLHADSLKILLLNSLPIWIVFTSFAFFRQTLPHWTGPAFTPLILIAAVYLSKKTATKTNVKRKLLFPVELKSSLFLLYGLLFAAWILINYYPGTIGATNSISKYGDTDFTLDMFGWDQIRTQFEAIVKDDSTSNSMTTNTWSFRHRPENPSIGLSRGRSAPGSALKWATM